MPRILVCGGRDYGNVVRTKANTDDEPPAVKARLAEYQHIQDFLSELVNNVSGEFMMGQNWLPTDVVIIHGGAAGADSAAGDFAAVNWCQELCFPADWSKYGRKAGYVRNKQMIEEGMPDLVVAFPGGNGTAMMVKLAKQHKIKAIEVGSKGSSPLYPAFQTDKYKKEFLDRIATQPAGQKMRVFHQCLEEEAQWMKNLEVMDQEYNDVIQAQSAMDDLNGQ